MSVAPPPPPGEAAGSTGTEIVPVKKLDLERVVARPPGGGQQFLPRTLQECLDFAQIMAKSDFAIPPRFRMNPGACLAVTIQSSRWGADPFGVIQKAYITKAKDGSERLAYEAQLVASVVNTQAPLVGRLKLVFQGEGTSRQLKVIGTFTNDPEPKELLTPKIKDIKVKNSPLWESDPDQQLAYYGQRAWGRRWCPEVLLGIYTPEELETEVLVEAPRPQVGTRVTGDDELADEGVERAPVEEPPVESSAVIEQAAAVTPEVPITHEEAARVDEMTPEGRAGGTEDDERDLPRPGLSDWEEYLEKSLDGLKDSELKTEADLDEYAGHVKTALAAAPLAQDDKDDLRARFVSALLNRKRELFGRKR